MLGTTRSGCQHEDLLACTGPAKSHVILETSEDWPTYLKPKQAKLAMTAAITVPKSTPLFICSALDLQLQFQGPIVVLISSSQFCCRCRAQEALQMEGQQVDAAHLWQQQATIYLGQLAQHSRRLALQSQFEDMQQLMVQKDSAITVRSCFPCTVRCCWWRDMLLVRL
jgi:hypothetical protein